MVVTEPGVYRGLDEATYHADPTEDGSLSVSGAKVLLDCPAKFDWQRNNPTPPRDVFDFGHAAHAVVLGVGLDVDVIEFDSWRSSKAQQAKKDAHAAGRTPLLAHDWAKVQAMAAALERHELARSLLSGSGEAEVSLFARDWSGVMLRGRVDWLPEPSDHMTVPDYKTAASADPNVLPKAFADFGYYMQAAWYSDLVTGLGLASSVEFVFVVQEKDPPHEVSVVRLEDEDVAIGRYRNRQAVDLYVECMEAGVWPGYGDEMHRIQLPGWFRRRFDGIELEVAL